MSKISFIPVKFNWVAIHPKPQGLVQFIGGFFWGTFPTLFYKKLLQDIYDSGYTIVVKPYIFTPNHWKASIDLVRSQEGLLEGIIQEAKRLGYQSEYFILYTDLLDALRKDKSDGQLPKGKYYWLGHSLGCKYIALLELLTDLEKEDIQKAVKNIIGEQETQKLLNVLERTDLSKISLKDQSSILIAPVISDLEDAIPIQFLQSIVKRLGFNVIPSKDETKQLIINSRLFNLIHLIELGNDSYAKETVNWLRQELKPKNDLTLEGLIHSAPVSIVREVNKVSDAAISQFRNH